MQTDGIVSQGTRGWIVEARADGVARARFDGRIVTVRSARGGPLSVGDRVRIVLSDDGLVLVDAASARGWVAAARRGYFVGPVSRAPVRAPAPTAVGPRS